MNEIESNKDQEEFLRTASAEEVERRYLLVRSMHGKMLSMGQGDEWSHAMTVLFDRLIEIDVGRAASVIREQLARSLDEISNGDVDAKSMHLLRASEMVRLRLGDGEL